MEKIRVQDFIDEYSQLNSDKFKENSIKRLLNLRYIPYEDKMAHAVNCLKGNIRDKEFIEVNTPMVYLNYVMSVLDLYTNLKLDPKKPLLTYNKLQEYRIVDAIMGLLDNEADVIEYNTIYNMCQNDFTQNYLSPRGFIQKQVQKLGVICNAGLNALGDSIKSLDKESLKEITNAIKQIRK